MLKCPVCQKELKLIEKAYKCENNHSYDISRFGYVNMLLANQHHSLNPGDSKEMILSRVRFLSSDAYSLLRNTILDTMNNLYKDYNEKISFCDIACGEGYYTTYIHQNFKGSIETFGIDISKFGVIECCKKSRALGLNDISFYIGNLFNLPFTDQSFDILLNCFAPMDEKEFARVLKSNGYYIRVLPDADHLYELKEVLYDKVNLNVMKELPLEGFSLVDTIKIKDKVLLKSYEQIYDLFTMTPYYYKSSLSSLDKLKQLSSLDLTISFVLLVYKKND